MLHERNVNNLRYAYFDDARMSIIIKGIAIIQYTSKQYDFFDKADKDKDMDMCSSLVNYYPKRVRVENMTWVALICAVCVIKFVKIAISM